MINIIELYNSVNEQLSKNNGRFIEVEEFNRIVNAVQGEYFKELVGATNKRVDGRTRVGYGNNQDADHRLDPFRDKKEVDVIDSEVSIGDDVHKITSISNKRNNRALVRIDEDRLGRLFDNPLRSPNEEDVYYLETGGGNLEVFGLVDTLVVRFLKVPKNAYLSLKTVTITAGSRTVERTEPDPDNSVNLEWSNTEYKTILNRVLNMFSTPNRDVFVTQKTERDKVSNE